ncbi:MAG: hypothetical protein WC208_10390 [Gallionella sp.]|jgi:hypothetical protein
MAEVEVREKIMDDVKFIDFVIKYEPKLVAIADLISTPIEKDSQHLLEEQISMLASKMELLSRCKAWAGEFIIIGKHKNLPVKRRDLTDTDRKIALEHSISKEILFSDWIENLREDLSTYLDKAQSLLASMRVTNEKTGYGKGQG